MQICKSARVEFKDYEFLGAYSSFRSMNFDGDQY